MIKKIYTILVLLFNLIVRRRHYKLHFIAEQDPPIKRWYYDFKYWGFDHANLEMVSGADALCDLYANGKDEVTVDIIASNKKAEHFNPRKVDEFMAEPLPKWTTWKDKYIWGRNYNATNREGEVKKMWICPVTLFVLGRYPKYLYIRK